MNSTKNRNYPQPKNQGGILIRETIRALRGVGISESITPHILCAVSGGLDSVALACLLVRYGRKIAPREAIRLVHVNHGWRGLASNEDEAFVRALAAQWDVPIDVVRLDPAKIPKGESWEDVARDARKTVYQKLSKKWGDAPVFTAHHADDLAETLLWRLFTGAAQTHGAGILVRDGLELRPFLRVRKTKLQTFLEEEGLKWREDQTNFEGRFLRARMRRDLLPLIESLFPQAVQHLVKLGTEAQRKPEKSARGYELASVFFKLVDGRIRRAHWEALEELQTQRRGELQLPNGWTLRHEGTNPKKSATLDRWVLEQTARKKASGEPGEI